MNKANLFDGIFRTFGHWTVSGNKIIVSDDAYLVEGDTGLCSLVGSLNADQIEYVHKTVNGTQFADLVKAIKANKAKDKLKKNFNKHFTKMLSECATDEERIAMTEQLMAEKKELGL